MQVQINTNRNIEQNKALEEINSMTPIQEVTTV